MRIEYEMTEDEQKEIVAACKPVVMIALQCGTPRSPQQNANDAWRCLAKKRGFVWDSVKPVWGKADRFFTAEEA